MLSLISKGDFVSSVCKTFSATFPNSVSLPTPITMPLPLPLVTTVPANAIFSLSASSVFFSKASDILFLGLVSPVNIDSSILKFLHSINLKSAGILLPDSKSTISPNYNIFGVYFY